MNNFGVYINKDKEVLHICSCGNTWINEDSNLECSKCKTKDFKNISRYFRGGKVTSGFLLKVKENGDWGFIVEKTNTNGKLDMQNNTLKLTGESKYTMYYDFRNNDFSIENSKGKKSQLNEYNCQYFFRDLDENNFIQTVSTDKFNALLRFARSSYGSCSSWYRPNKLSKGLPRIINKPMYQILSSAGFSIKFLESIKNILESYRYEDSHEINKEASQPHLILNIPKYMIKYIKITPVDRNILQNLIIMDKKFGADAVKSILEKLLDECDINTYNDFMRNGLSQFIETTENYNYECKRLIEYICRDVKLNQGITKPTEALTLIKDYMRMMTFMNLNPNKYTKSLKKDHDIASMNYEVGKDIHKKDIFKKVTEQITYKNLEYKDKNYVIVLPQEPNDLVTEGKNLSHCVASYVEDVIKEKCKIVFIRDKEKTDNSLLTVEIRNNKIVQVKGFANRIAENEEKEFINKWAENKGLLYCA